MEQVLCIGHAAYDITLQLEKFPKENTKIRIGDAITCTGGAATNAGFLLSNWGIDTYLAAVVGNDDNGKEIMQELKQANIHIDYLQVSEHFKTTSSYILASRENGTRTIVISRTKQEEASIVDFHLKPAGIIADGEEPNWTKHAIEQFPNAISVLDAGSLKPAILELANFVDYFVCSRDFAEEYCKIKINPERKQTIIPCYEKMFQDFNTNIVITLGEFGSFTKYNGQYHLVPSIKVKAIDSTGSGDLYHGAFLYFLLKGKDLLTTMRYANIVGALASRFTGRVNSIPTLEEVLRSY